MDTTVKSNASKHFEKHNNLHTNLSGPLLVEKILSREEGVLTATGAVRATTGKYTGRSPQDRFVVREKVSDSTVDWRAVNQPIDEASFESLYKKVVDHLHAQDEIFSFKGFSGEDKKYPLDVEVINEYAWHNFF